MKIRQIVTLVLCLTAGATQAHAQSYRSVFVDVAWQLLVTQSGGTIFKAPQLRDQISFSQPSLSKDQRTLARLANYADPIASPGSADPIAARLVLYRAGRVLRMYRTDQVFWSWQSAHNNEDVAFCTGPSHGGADTCELHRIRSGQLLAKWNARAAGDPPPWLNGLGYRPVRAEPPLVFHSFVDSIVDRCPPSRQTSSPYPIATRSGTVRRVT